MSHSGNILKRCFIICPNPSIDILARIASIDPKTSNRILEEKRFPGGKGVHVALALSEMGVPVTLIGLWSVHNGNWLMDACKEKYPNLEIIGPQIRGFNRSCFTFESSDAWQDTEILGTGPKISAADFLSIQDILIERKDEMACAAICGSWPKGAEGDYNEKLVVLTKGIAVPMYLDCTGAQLKNALDAKPFCIHLNRKEVTEYFGQDFESAKNNLTNFCTIAAVTDGAHGLYLLTEEGEIHANVTINEVKSTVGSGDCLLAGIIKGHYESMTQCDTAKLGAACGAANCLNEDLGMLKKSDVDILFERTIVQMLN